VKGYPKFPVVFTDDIEATIYFVEFFEFYNNFRYHGKIGFVTPNQRHTGADIEIIERRKKGLSNARTRRLERNTLAVLDMKIASA